MYFSGKYVSIHFQSIINNRIVFSLLAIKNSEDRLPIIRKAAGILLNNLSNRFPLEPIAIAAAIIDPNIQHFAAIDDWLCLHDKTRATLLQEIQEDLQIENTVVSEQSQNANIQDKSLSIRVSLIRKYSTVHFTHNSLQEELNRFKMIVEEVPDVLQFWRSNENNFPKLARFAKVLLSKPATSAKSESAFSVAGALLSVRRATIDPGRVEKTLFLHDNYNLLLSDSDL